jgi:protein TonB
VILGCLAGSLLVHGVAYGVLEEIERPAVKRRTSEDIIRQRPEPRPQPHPVKLEEKKLPEPPRPEPPRTPPRREAAPKLTPRTPPPVAALTPPRTSPRPVLDLTMGAGVNENLTSDSGEFSVHTGDSALGDPSIAPMAPPPPPMAAPPVPEAPPPPMRPPPPVYVKILPEAVSVPQVAYPAAARRQQVEGTVTLEVTVGADGKVLRVKVLKGIGYGLDEAATRALESARFKPAKGSDGRPMTYTIRYRYTFKIER